MKTPGRRVRALLASVLVLVPAAVAASQAREWNFTVYLDEREIGEHRFRVFETDGLQQVRSEARFDVRILFFDAYRYRHRSDEAWRGDCLVSIEARTDDNGDTQQVSGEARETHFQVRTDAGQAQLPACVMSFAYWDPDFLQAPRLLNAQTGEYLPVQVQALGADEVQARGARVPARRYAVVAGEDFRIDLWYSQAGEWLALESTTGSGRTLRYRLQ